MSTNNYTVIDRRNKMSCGCGCGQEASLAHFAVHEHTLILPGCLDSHKERKASQCLLREIVLTKRGLFGRGQRAAMVYRLQRSIFARQGAAQARRTAFRSTVIYLVGTRAGLLISKMWRKG